MAIRLKKQMKLSQNISLTKELQQSIKILALNVQDLKQNIQEEILENPLLEEETLEKDPVEKDPSFNLATSYTKPRESSLPFDDYMSTPPTLKQHLLWQAQVDGSSEEEKNLLSLLIFYLDDRGYLSLPLAEIAEKESCSEQALTQTLAKLHSMDPPGVGARDLKECLLLQAKHLCEDTKDMVCIIQNHLHHLEKKEYGKLAQSLKLPEEALMDLVKIISLMEPNPGRGFYQGQASVYASPDVYIYKKQGEYRASVNEQDLPRLKLSSQYKHLLKKQMSKEETQAYIKEKLQVGSWFLRALREQKKDHKKSDSLLD